MGKSSKKLKSERINALRKQYDVFLEEDKRRKERNEYILGRLDKMRYSTALVPVRDKTRPHINPPTRDIQIPMNKQQIFQNNLQGVEDTYIIQEISKNYILIPKLRSTFTNPHTQQIVPVIEQSRVRDVQNLQENAIDTADAQYSATDNNWQSKYEILNILKKEEKEKQVSQSPSAKSISATLLNDEIPMNEKIGNNYENIAKNINENIENKYMHELPEKDMPGKKDLLIDNHSSKDNDYANTQTHHIVPEKTDHKEYSALLNDIVEVIDYSLQNTNLEDGHSKVSTLADDITNYAGHGAEMNSLDHVTSSEPTHKEEELQKVYNKHRTTGKQYDEINEQEHLQNSNNWSHELQPSIDQILKLGPTNEMYVDEQKTNSIQITDPADVMKESDALNILDSNATIPNVNDTFIFEHNDELLCVPGIDDQEPPIEKSYEVKNTAVDEEHIDDTDLQAFNAEQREMFYMEQPGEAYNPQDDVNVNEQEYLQNEEEDQNQEHYYYENTQPEAYPANVDVNDEQTLRYDPSYQQQYVESYEKSYEHQPQEHEVDQNNYQMNSEQLEQTYAQESNETPEGIESTLDTEEGYVKEQDDDENLVETPETENRQT